MLVLMGTAFCSRLAHGNSGLAQSPAGSPELSDSFRGFLFYGLGSQPSSMSTLQGAMQAVTLRKAPAGRRTATPRP